MVPADETIKASRTPTLQNRVTASITAAFFDELAEVGYGQMSVDSIVRRAGIGKAAVYRRWPTKKAMAIALISEVAVRVDETPDTGSLRDDVVALIRRLDALLSHPLTSRIISAVVAEAGLDPELEIVLRDTVEGPRRQNNTAILRRAIQRGELSAGCDVDLALDLLAGPLYWRLLVRRESLDVAAGYRLADGLVAAFGAI